MTDLAILFIAIACVLLWCTVKKQTVSDAITFTTPNGVGGWLLFFCIMLTVVQPLVTLTVLLNSQVNLGAWLTSLDGLLTAPKLVLGAVTGFKLWRKDASALGWVVGYLCYGFGACLIFFVDAMIATGGKLDTETQHAVIIDATRNGIQAVVLGSYFHKSKRVRDTLGKNLYQYLRN